jgi:cellulose biosynthesis protein BcsQ
MNLLWADSPSWTNKEVLGTIISVVLALIPVCAGVIRFVTSRYRTKINSLRIETARLSRELEGQTPVAELERAKLQHEEAVKQAKFLETERDELRKALDGRAAEIEGLQAAAETFQGDHAAAQRRIARALKKDGQTWTERVLANAPEFRRLDPDERRMPIISVLNLKGGVGKTTVTANLAAALDSLGWRVLVLDLDLQGSLSNLFASDFDLAEFSKNKQLLNDFLEASFDREHPSLVDYVHGILSSESGLVPATDDLFYAETNLTIRWLLREGNRDPRFLLRKELHLKRITNRYDIVLMDCPPVFNVCCVNALAASDYVVVPILATRQSTARVPILLKRLKAFKDNINSDLHVMGIVANRTLRSELTIDEENRLSALGDMARDAYGMPVPLFESFVRNSTGVRVAEDEHRPLLSSDAAYANFIDLANEVIGKLPNFCRPARSESRAKEVVA